MTLTKRTKSNYPVFGNWDSFFNDEFFHLPENWKKTGTTMPSVNIREDEKAFYVDLAAPGKQKADFNIEVHDNVLSISSEQRTSSEEVNEDKYTRKEFSYESFKRSFTLPQGADQTSISATYTDGILSICIPRVAPKTNGKKMIEIS